MSKFKPGELVYHKLNKMKHGLGIVRDDHATDDPEREIYSVISWRFPHGTGNGLVQCVKNTDLVRVNYDDIDNDADRKWLHNGSVPKNIKRTIENKRVIESSSNNVVADPKTFKKNMGYLDRQIRRVMRTRMRWVKSELALIQSLFKHMDKIQVPHNDEEIEAMDFYIKQYDEAIKKIEDEFVSKYRRFMKE